MIEIRHTIEPSIIFTGICPCALKHQAAILRGRPYLPGHGNCIFHILRILSSVAADLGSRLTLILKDHHIISATPDFIVSGRIRQMPAY